MADVVEGDGSLGADERNLVLEAGYDDLFAGDGFLTEGNEPTVGPEARDGVFVSRSLLESLLAVRIAGGGNEGEIEELLAGVLLSISGGFHNGLVTADDVEERFGDESGIANHEHVSDKLTAHGSEALGVGGVCGEVLDFPGVDLGVVEFFGGLVVFPKGCVDARELSFFPSFMPSGPGSHLELIEGVRCAPGVWSKVADVFVATGCEATSEAVDLIEAVAEEKGVSVFGGFLAIGAEEGAALHVGVVFEASKGEEGRGEIDEGDDFITDAAVFESAEVLPFFGDVEGHWDADSGVVEVALAAWGRAAVVAVVENDGVISEAVLL